ncbi:M20 family metallopeptidase [Streptomyces triticirhizae]|uniref:M20 family metallopeptidase n=1 Tax=Streptomyces triticirhizae TaxID=2483353 RepID=UPI00131554FE|nr:M20 family metallopeptidase [Streptomyces triticirhizae]
MGTPAAGRADDAARHIAGIDRDRLAATLVDLIGLPSVNPFGAPPVGEAGERKVADYLGRRLEGLGWACETTEFAPGRYNLVARSPRARATGHGRSLMLAGHMDTVETTGYPEALSGTVRDGRVYGRGACDMKAALACYVEVAEVLAERGLPPNGELLIAGVGDEEYRQEGAKALGRSGPRVDGVIVGEPTELRICHATKGLAAYDLTVTGRATHSSVPHHGTNAVLAAAELLGFFPRYARQLERHHHPLLGHPTVNVGTIEGGVKPNIVPSRCRVGLSRRLLPGETPAVVRAEIAELLGAPDDRLPWSLGDAWWTVEPYELPDDHALAEVVRAAATEEGIPDTAPHGFPASSDAAYFGSPVLLFGPGSLAQAHSLDEWVAVDDMVTATAVYLRAALALPGLPSEAGGAP